jgi:hypothetical protein
MARSTPEGQHEVEGRRRDVAAEDQRAKGQVAKKTTSPTRNASQIEADVAAARHRLAASMEALIDEVHPNRIKQRTIDGVRQYINTQVETAKSLVFTARGDLRTDRVVAIGAAAVGTIAFVVIVRSLMRRAQGG